MALVGRKNEQSELLRLLDSEQAEFIMVYGRRRVGKTYLIREAFKNKFAFYMTGMNGVGLSEQLQNFSSSLVLASGNSNIPKPESWFDAFEQLRNYLQNLDSSKKIIFLDELPWMDSKDSKFLSALEHFWNSYASATKNIKLIVCGSAASWMVKKIVENHGGLHNRITYKLKLNPFDVTETKAFLESKNIYWDNRTISECYMALGGIPYYLNLLSSKLSLAQNLDALFFSETALLDGEFKSLYASLFLHSEEYTAIIEILSRKKVGFTRDEIISQLKVSDGGGITRKLTELEQCGFIRKYKALGKVTYLYQLIDFYSLFYFSFLEKGKDYDKDTWMHLQNSSTYKTWCGLSFERFCIAHAERIKSILGISGISTKTYSFYSPEAQIDMVIERGDRVVNLFEMKYTDLAYSLDKKDAASLENKMLCLQSKLKKRQSIMNILVTTSPMKQSPYSSRLIQRNITLDEIVE